MNKLNQTREEYAAQFMDFSNESYMAFRKMKHLPPRKLKKYLDEYIVGQDQAKRDLTSAIFNQQLIGLKHTAKSDTILEKSNVLLLGPTGSGKTAMLQRLADKLGVPFVIEDATEFTSSGYVGRDTEDMLRDLINKSKDHNGYKLINGIIYLDEVDKIARVQTSTSHTADPSHMELQANLLKMLEGSDVQICMATNRHIPGSPSITFNTRNILFICGGAFAGIEKIVARRLRSQQHSQSGIGFGSAGSRPREYTQAELYAQVTVDDLVEYGMSREFLGRLPIITRTEPLERDTLLKILTEPKNSLVKQYTEMFELIAGASLSFTPKALKAIADQAVAAGTGARALRGIMESVLRDALFEAPGSGCLQVRVEADKKGQITALLNDCPPKDDAA